MLDVILFLYLFINATIKYAGSVAIVWLFARENEHGKPQLEIKV
jgi:hypothetical protein